MDDTKDANGHEPSACDADVSRQEPEPATVAIVSASAIGEKPPVPCASQRKKTGRKDVGHLHAMRHGLRARHSLEVLRRLGENTKALRRLEKRLRAALKPTGVVKELLFDKFWTSYLRSLLAVRIEAMVVAALAVPVDRPTGVPSLVEREMPTLVDSEMPDHRFESEDRFASVLQDLCLLQRYEIPVRKEEFRALALLLASLGDGEEGLAQAIAQMLGINREAPKG